jgi:hypothetical protein
MIKKIWRLLKSVPVNRESVEHCDHSDPMQHKLIMQMRERELADLPWPTIVLAECDIRPGASLRDQLAKRPASAP